MHDDLLCHNKQNNNNRSTLVLDTNNLAKSMLNLFVRRSTIDYLEYFEYSQSVPPLFSLKIDLPQISSSADRPFYPYRVLGARKNAAFDTLIEHRVKS